MVCEFYLSKTFFKKKVSTRRVKLKVTAVDEVEDSERAEDFSNRKLGNTVKAVHIVDADQEARRKRKPKNKKYH